MVVFGMGVTYAQAQQQYHFTDLGTLGSFTSYAFGINNGGQIVGYSYPTNDVFNAHGYVYNNGLMTDLGKPFGGNTFVHGINGTGEMVGEGDATNGFQHGYIYTNGVITDLRPLGIDRANAINSTAQVAGRLFTGSTLHAAFYSNGTATDLGTLNGGTFDQSEALGLNDGAKVAGYSTIGAKDINLNDITHPVSWVNGVISDLGNFGGTKSQATDIDPTGRIVGWSDTTFLDMHGNGGSPHPFLYANGVLKDLSPIFGGGALSINDNGLIVGWALGQAALYDTNGLIATLNARTPDLSPGFTMQFATGINDNGLITGYGTNSLGDTHGFLLTPIPEPSVGLGVGLVVLLGGRRDGRGKKRRGETLTS